MGVKGWGFRGWGCRGLGFGVFGLGFGGLGFRGLGFRGLRFKFRAYGSWDVSRVPGYKAVPLQGFPNIVLWVQA